MKVIVTISAAFKRNVIVRRLLCSLLALTFLGVFFIAKSSSEVHVGLIEELSVSANGGASDGSPSKLSKSYSLPDIDNYVNIPYFINSEEMTSTLVLNNNLPDVAQAEVTLFNRQGKPLKLPVFTLQPFNAERFNLAEFTSDAAGDFSSGNVQIFYRGPMMAITSQITVSPTSRRISFDSTESSMMDYHSSQLDGILWLPDSETRAWAALTNTAASSIPVVAQAGLQKRTVTLGPRETQVIELRDFIAGGPDKFPAALLTLGHSGAPGALIATGFAYDEHKGFSTSLPFVDRSTIATKMLAGAHFKFGPAAFNAGFPWGTTFRAPLVLANSGNSTDLASVTVDHTLNGVPNRVDLGRIKVEAKQIKQLDLAQELSSRGLTGPVDDAGIQITYTGQPKSLIARLTSLDETGDFVFDTPIKDPLAGSFRLSGNYPWRLDGKYSDKFRVSYG